MPLKKHTPEEIIGKLREVEVVLAQGGTTAEACRRIAVSFHGRLRGDGVRQETAYVLIILMLVAGYAVSRAARRRREGHLHLNLVKKDTRQ